MKRIYYGWWIVLGASLINFFGSGTFYYSFTAFFNPIVNEFGWSYAATSFAASLRSVEAGIASPLVGLAADRYGARCLILLGSVLTGLGFIFLSQINSLWTYYIVFVFFSIGYSLLVPVAGFTAVANWFGRKRGTALGLVSAAVAPSGIFVFVVNWLISLYGWRATLIILGVGTWMVGIPCSLIMRSNPEFCGPIPKKGIQSNSLLRNPDRSAREKGLRIKESGVLQALKTRAFWIIALTVTVSSIALASTTVHIMPYLISVHFSREQASLVVFLLVFVSIIGRLGLGALSDRMDKRRLLAFGLFLQALGLLIFCKTETLWQALIFVFLFGPGFGGIITLRLVILGEYFGRKVFGSIQGITLGIMTIGAMAGPFLTGMVYDIYKSYRLAWLILAIVIFATIPLSLKIPDRKH